jgi:hypothetical protein
VDREDPMQVTHDDPKRFKERPGKLLKHKTVEKPE